MKNCQECGLVYDSATCPECECSRQFTELENNSLKLIDELNELSEGLQCAKENILIYELAINEMHRLIRQNDIALRDFKWWR